ncbi:ABC transporter permease [Marinobacterium lutimaris]|uniref:NitT/TauT family transport system permease protein n=1 Tax=Marinobacterium lutimaris TaxID=568106 RepID=A0A1H6BED4_9GAMM|nr:ABC transporter permease [Marinobacterium lutimaris]SEG59138.1 NitT/TauT family transport system permease protein [Marinobacterium lutimaris]
MTSAMTVNTQSAPVGRLVLIAAGAAALLLSLWITGGEPGAYNRQPIWLVLIPLMLLGGWFAMEQLTALGDRLESKAAVRAVNLAVPTLFAVLLLVLWQLICTGFAVPSVLLPAPGTIGITFFSELETLAKDFAQTWLKAVLAGWLIGCGSGFVVALLIDRSPFLQKGLMPIGNIMSSIPIVGIAPIMVMWFGFDWQSKAAVVVIMTFFPMLVNTLAGLHASDNLHLNLLHTYAGNRRQTLWYVQLPAALPFIFNALKINSTLALIGAIVAEFFGTPIVGMGFRISTEVGRMNMDMVWATILVAALAGSISYGLLALLERKLTFWHPSTRAAG